MKYREGKLTADRIRELENLGFEWTAPNRGKGPKNEEQWEGNFAGERGNCNLRRVECGGLGRWVDVQRTLQKEG